MKHIVVTAFLLCVLLISCIENKETKISNTNNSTDVVLEIPNSIVDKSVLHYHNKISLWTLNDQPYSGYAVSFHQDSTLKEKVGILNGRKENQAKHWYLDGHLRLVANYHKGKLHGEKKMWSSDTSHVLLSYLNYQSGKPHGEQKKWYPTGELHKKLNIEMGLEEGLQKAWLKNGKLYVNYEAKNGRIFGLKKAKLCYELDKEVLQ